MLNISPPDDQEKPKTRTLTLWAVVLHYLSLIFMDYPARVHRRWWRGMQREGRLPAWMLARGALDPTKVTPDDDDFSDTETVTSLADGRRGRSTGRYAPEEEDAEMGQPPRRTVNLKRPSRQRRLWQSEEQSDYEVELGWMPKRTPQHHAISGGRDRQLGQENSAVGHSRSGAVPSVLSLPRNSVPEKPAQLKKPSFTLARFSFGKREQKTERGAVREQDAAEGTAQAGNKGVTSARDGAPVWNRCNKVRKTGRQPVGGVPECKSASLECAVFAPHKKPNQLCRTGNPC